MCHGQELLVRNLDGPAANVRQRYLRGIYGNSQSDVKHNVLVFTFAMAIFWHGDLQEYAAQLKCTKL